MKIIQKIANPSGAYPAPQDWNNVIPPDGYAALADTVDMTEFYAHNGFVTLTIDAVESTRQDETCTIDTVTAYEPNTEAWEAWRASLPDSAVSELTAEERIATLEEQLAESDAVALALYEGQMEQEAVIAEHDEAILGIYEMIGG